MEIPINDDFSKFNSEYSIYKNSPEIIYFLVILFDKKSYRDKGNGATEPFFDVFMNKFHNAEFWAQF